MPSEPTAQPGQMTQQAFKQCTDAQDGFQRCLDEQRRGLFSSSSKGKGTSDCLKEVTNRFLSCN